MFLFLKTPLPFVSNLFLFFYLILFYSISLQKYILLEWNNHVFLRFNKLNRTMFKISFQNGLEFYRKIASFLRRLNNFDTISSEDSLIIAR